jgi:hypothetical protein
LALCVPGRDVFSDILLTTSFFYIQIAAFDGFWQGQSHSSEFSLTRIGDIVSPGAMA